MAKFKALKPCQLREGGLYGFKGHKSERFESGGGNLVFCGAEFNSFSEAVEELVEELDEMEVVEFKSASELVKMLNEN